MAKFTNWTYTFDMIGDNASIIEGSEKGRNLLQKFAKL